MFVVIIGCRSQKELTLLHQVTWLVWRRLRCTDSE